MSYSTRDPNVHGMAMERCWSLSAVRLNSDGSSHTPVAFSHESRNVWCSSPKTHLAAFASHLYSAFTVNGLIWSSQMHYELVCWRLVTFHMHNSILMERPYSHSPLFILTWPSYILHFALASKALATFELAMLQDPRRRCTWRGIFIFVPLLEWASAIVLLLLFSGCVLAGVVARFARCGIHGCWP